MSSTINEPNYHFRRVWWGLAIILITTVAYFSTTPGEPFVSSKNYGDKLLHLATYLGLMFFLGQRCVRAAHWTLAVYLVLLGAVLEIIQLYVGRSFELEDIFANCLGVLFAWIALAHPLARSLLFHIDHWIVNRLIASRS
ncbi:MAG: VanZ family protein [Gammaproteobacteria bacterium]|nr:VanZ family protein [Gammaproteobacteria bacterium]